MYFDNPSTMLANADYDDNPDFDDNPVDGLLSNRGPFGREALTSYFVAATGTGFGLIIADFLDRYVATMKPKDSTPTVGTGNHPWYGRNAAAAQRRRPDAIRLGAQALGALAAMGGAYLTRNVRILPWLLGGAAVGFGANLLKMLWDWWAAPAIFKVDPATPMSLANRMYALEQKDVQDTIDGLFENWAGVTSLAANQVTGDLAAGSIRSPLAESTASDLYVLGGARRGGNGQAHARTQQLAGQSGCTGRAEFTPTGRVGACSYCGGVGGCYCGCPWIQANVPAGMDHCVVTWQAGMSLADIIAQTGVDLGAVLAINSRYGVNIDEAVGPAVGSQVYLPVAACAYVQQGVPAVVAPPLAPLSPTFAPVVPTAVAPPMVPSMMRGVSGAGDNGQSADAGANARSLMSQHAS